ncbi:endonuclease/exonuclease/phosphatase family protein [Pleionea sp. CnH1-48]|uniref:endonuclease/exonuclease/phosphatase family protein n=1 Tax=Pleionea sp. CnH1-48 TaxID=2954494 RepID=UPI002096B3B9|nr:endonuclease/exonuclease/phosphatase family protein [Pleionea sp. CnH1-48]MCO7223359.1 endonuclease/exonuclease/phosphatase family protein [Pleionea sp. CnH1-48]
MQATIKRFLLPSVAGLALVASAPTLADVDPGTVMADIPGLVSDLWPKGKKNSGGKTFSPEDIPMNNQGEFSVVTYNVDGFPHSIGGNKNSEFKAIVKILNTLPIDILVMQELFIKDKHSKVKDHLSDTQYPYRSKHFRGNRVSFGDGLLRVSQLPFDNAHGFVRSEWPSCYDIDCYTEKGFTFQRHYLSKDLTVDVYNLHNDAGGQEGDIKAKKKAMAALANFINANSDGNAIIVAGDYNLGWHDPESRPKAEEFRVIIEDFLAATNLTFACEAVTGNLDTCTHVFNKPDHIAFRGNNKISLEAIDLNYLDNFKDNSGKDLSDHWPLEARFYWTRK